MLRNLMTAGLALVALSGCGGGDESAKMGRAADGFAEAGAPPLPPMAAPAPSMAEMDTASRERMVVEEQQQGGQPADPNQPAQPADSRLIAYTYFYSFVVPTGNMEGLLNAHKAACENAGPAQCYIVNSSISGLGSENSSGQLIIKGSRDWVENFQKGMEEGLKPFGADLDSNNSTAEDLTVQILDTTARLNSAKTLRDRLQELLRDRPGRLSDLLEIERELARVQAEIDSTESILAAMKLRVSMSTLTLNYQPKYSAVSESIWRPLGDAFSGFLPNVVASLAGIIAFISQAALWIILIVAVVWFVWWRLRRKRKAVPAPTPSSVKSA